MLAWIRTGIAMITFGFVIARVGVWLRMLAAADSRTEINTVGTAWIGAAFLALGTFANAMAAVRYRHARRAILSGTELPDGGFPVIFAVVATVLGAVLGTYLLLHLV